MFKVIKVTGESLSPLFNDGDYVVITTAAFFLKKINRGDIVVFKHEDIGIMIKAVESVNPGADTVYVRGTHPTSVDSQQLGPIRKDALIGKVIWHIPQPG